MQVVFCDEHTPWIETGGHPSDLVTGIENRLPAWRCLCSEFGMVALVPQPQGTLQPCDET